MADRASVDAIQHAHGLLWYTIQGIQSESQPQDTTTGTKTVGHGRE